MGTNLKAPWELYPEIWCNQSAFFTYLRGNLRKIWSLYPAKLKWKASKLVNPPADYAGRAKKLGQCEYCLQMFAASHLEVDHKDMAGQCNSWETASEFLYKLLDCNDNWKLTCKPCHKIKSNAERKGLSFEDSAIDKEVIRICKEEKLEDVIDFIESYNYNGDYKTNNASNRRKAVEDILKSVT